MNPIADFRSFQHIQDAIFSYLSIEDLLTASLVSLEWFNAIAGSSSCMKRIIFSYEYRGFRSPAVIRRPYQFFECLNSEAIEETLNILKKCIFVKSIRILNKFSSLDDLVKLLKVRAMEVEELIIQEIVIDDTNQLTTQLNFPKLKNLQLKYVDLHIECLIEVLESVSSLNSLSIYLHDDLSIKAIRKLWRFIEANKSLTSLTIISNNCGQLFTESISCDAINLKSLEIREISMLEAKNEQENLFNFLNAQKSSLERLHMGEICSTDIFNLIIEELSMLSELSIRSNSNDIETNQKKNYSITKLNLKDSSLIKTLTRSCRAIKILNICSLTDEVFLDIADTLPFLEELILESLDMGMIAEGKFLSMKKISFKIYSDKVLRHPLSINDNFHRLVANEIEKLKINNHNFPLTLKRRNCSEK